MWAIRPAPAGRTLIPVEPGGEPTFGLEREPQKGIPTVAEFAAKWRQETDAVAFMPMSTYTTLRDTGLPMIVIASQAKNVVVRRP